MSKVKTASDLLDTLLPEAFQTEESARAHPAREAERLGATPPSAAMVAISRHAAASLVRLRELAEKRGKKAAKAGVGLGQLFSLVRTVATDRLYSSERSYRLTIVGVQHGIGLFVLLEEVAATAGDEELAAFCASLLRERRALCAAAEDALRWFAQHPAKAARKAHP